MFNLVILGAFGIFILPMDGSLGNLKLFDNFVNFKAILLF